MKFVFFLILRFLNKTVLIRLLPIMVFTCRLNMGDRIFGSPIYKNIYVLIMWPIYVNKSCSHSSSSVTCISSVTSGSSVTFPGIGLSRGIPLSLI